MYVEVHPCLLHPGSHDLCTHWYALCTRVYRCSPHAWCLSSLMSHSKSGNIWKQISKEPSVFYRQDCWQRQAKTGRLVNCVLSLALLLVPLWQPRYRWLVNFWSQPWVWHCSSSCNTFTSNRRISEICIIISPLIVASYIITAKFKGHHAINFAPATTQRQEAATLNCHTKDA